MNEHGGTANGGRCGRLGVKRVSRFSAPMCLDGGAPSHVNLEM